VWVLLTSAPLYGAYHANGIPTVTDKCNPVCSTRSARMPAVERRTLVRSIPAAAALFSRALWAASEGGGLKSAQDSTAVYELRVYHVAPGKMPDLLTRFRDHTVKLFEQHGIESVAYWSPLDEPEKGNTLIYVLRHPSREAADANWKSFRDDPNWQSVRDKSEENGKLVDRVDSTFMVLTDFSPRGGSAKP
jgi:hypothetical protein